MNILLTSEYFYPFEPGGTEKSAFLLASSLVKAGHKVSVFTPNYGAEKKECIDGIEILRYPFPKKLQQGERLRDIYTITPLFDIYMAYYLNKALKIIKPDIIHSQNTLSLCASVKSGLKNGIPVVHTIRDYGLLCPSAMCLIKNTKVPPDCSRKKLWKECSLKVIGHLEETGSLIKLKVKLNHQIQVSIMNNRRKCLKKTSKNVFVSYELKRIFSETMMIPQNTCEVVYNFASPPQKPREADTERIKIKYNLDGNKLVLVPGVISIKKGTSLAVETAEEIVKKHKDIVFIFPGRMEFNVESKNNSIILPGHLTNKEMNILYSLSSLVICPSIYPEPFGRTAIEAFSYSVPVVASAIGGYKEIVKDNKNGILVTPGDKESLGRAILTILKNSELHKQFSAQALEDVKNHFSDEIIVQQVEELYKAIFIT